MTMLTIKIQDGDNHVEKSWPLENVEQYKMPGLALWPEIRKLKKQLHSIVSQGVREAIMEIRQTIK